jgi:hypothetical protein
MRRTRRTRLLCAVIAATGGVGLALSMPAHAARQTGLVITTKGSISLDWTAGASGQLTVCNATAKPVAPSIRVDASDTASKPFVTSVTTALKPKRLAPAKCGTLTVALKQTIKPDAGPITPAKARVTLLSTAGAASAALVIQKVPPNVIGTIGDISLNAIMKYPFAVSHFDDSPSVMVVKLAGTPPTTFPTEYAKSATLVDGNHHGRLRVVGIKRLSAKPSSDNAIGLKVKWRGPSHAGTYKGTLEFGGDKGSIPVTVVVSDAVWVLLVLVLLGIAVGFLLRAITGRWRYSWRAKRSRNNLAGASAAAYKKLPAKWQGSFSEPDVAGFVTENSAQLDAYLHTVFIVNPKDAAYASAVDALDAAFADADTLAAKLGDNLDALQSAYDELVKWIGDYLPGASNAAIVASAKAILDHTTPHALGVGDATRFSDGAAATTALLHSWKAVAIEVARNQTWLREMALTRNARANEAAGLTTRTMYELADADTADAISHVRASHEFVRARELIVELAVTKNHWVREPQPVPKVTRKSVVAEGVTRFAEPLLKSSGDVIDDIGKAIAKYVPAIGSRVSGLVLAGATSVVALLLALWTAYHTLYDGHAFGGWRDWVTAFITGLGLSVVLDAIVAGITWARSGRAALRADPEKT